MLEKALALQAKPVHLHLPKAPTEKAATSLDVAPSERAIASNKKWRTPQASTNSMSRATSCQMSISEYSEHSTISNLSMLYQKMFGIKGRHTARTRSGNGLAILFVLYITSSKDTKNTRGCSTRLGENVTRFI